jgi:hypothetical protein
MNVERYGRLLVLPFICLLLSSCVRPRMGWLQYDNLDHTAGALIHDRAECACLARLKLTTDPVSKKPCFSAIDAGLCGMRADCIMPEAPEPLRRSALSCRTEH